VEVDGDVVSTEVDDVNNDVNDDVAAASDAASVCSVTSRSRRTTSGKTPPPTLGGYV